LGTPHSPEGLVAKRARRLSAGADPHGDRLTYEWGFGDGISGTGRRVSHVFTRTGTLNGLPLTGFLSADLSGC